MNRMWRAIALLAAGVALASSSFAKDAGLVIDACSLLTAADIKKELGLSVEAGSRRDSGLESNGAYSSACVWLFTSERERQADPDAPLGGRSFVILNALRWPEGSDGARTYLQAFREASDSGVLPKQPSARSLGDESLWWGDGLAVRKGTVSFGVSVFTPRQAGAAPNAKPGEREERLAKVILSRLAAQGAGRK